ncbi:flagellar motor protein MotD [Lysobacter sp. D1-1-M9]|uniref:flagellar motor protein MotD n=1 Tax=Novilysobacter longmucuonensis TaxID=3098603 RepID=UPI002FC7DA8E
MARRRDPHADHTNHEAWAIPYGDLVTLLLAFFVVMYAISSVNEGKYRMIADALSSAFGGPPRTIAPVQLGATQPRSFDRPAMQTAAAKAGPAPVDPIANLRVRQIVDMPTFGQRSASEARAAAAAAHTASDIAGRDTAQLQALGQRIEDALSELVRQKLVKVRRGATFLEVEIQSDILFASGVAVPNAFATSTVRRLAAVLRGEPNSVRVEGYTDNMPIKTAQFPSNWELSAARAASVVHVMIDADIEPDRLAVVGFGSHQPIADNGSVEGRNSNRRVLLVILASPQGPDAIIDELPPMLADHETGADADTAQRHAGATLPAPLAPAADNDSTGAAATRPPQPVLPVIATAVRTTEEDAG